ncbi:glycosyltransferase [Bremerella cremea]|uniref:Glycosyltransferase n=1 Tax=Bremerella cremea TaxID=1031537 RepID=A0A368KTP0_9BACT|nr:glycosyltransferase family 2 protein [Bremerella cremea]RCS49482.1 glycosyltransferase [Bremerella cremea]
MTPNTTCSPDDITFCIKTVHRPWSCHRLVESLRSHFSKPQIIVVDDGECDRRFSVKYPDTAKYCRVINLDDIDVGVGVGRNTAIDAADTEYIFLLDDDHVVTQDFHLDRVCRYFQENEIDILGVRQGDGGRPLRFAPLMNGRRIWMFRGEHRRLGSLAWCDMSSNAFLARQETIAKLRWDPEIKTYEHWEFFYRASHVEHLKIAVAEDCKVVHKHVANNSYGGLRARPRFRKLGLRKHGFDSMRYPGGGIVRA